MYISHVARNLVFEVSDQVLLEMGNKFEITIDYRFTIGKTKPNSYLLYNRFIATFSHNGEIQPTLLDKLIKFQKRAARLILNKAMETPSAKLFQQLGWMRFDERVIYRKAILMYKSLHNLAPTYLSTKFTYASDIHQVNPSSLTDFTLYVPKLNLEIYRKTFAYSGSKIWNTLPESVCDAPSLWSFKQRYLRWKKTIT